MTHPILQPLIISAPFGNYIQPRGATPTLGTFTAAARPGRVRQVLRTVRRYRRIGAWVNRIGLRNPGIGWLADRVAGKRIEVSDKIVSVHGFCEDDWRTLLQHAARLRPGAVELNMSCPNVGELAWPEDLFARAIEAAGDAERLIVKLPPVNYELRAEQALAAGVQIFHCCNTLPVPAGGLSGKPLKPVALACIGQLRSRLTAEQAGRVRIIGGGGITEPADIDDYVDAGVSHVAIGTRVMNPIYLLTHRPLQPLIDHAHHRLRTASCVADPPPAPAADAGSMMPHD